MIDARTSRRSRSKSRSIGERIGRSAAVLGWLVSALTAGFALGCSDPLTQIILVVDTDVPVPAGFDSIQIEAEGPEMVGGEITVDLAASGAPSLPLTQSLHPLDDESVAVVVDVTATLDGVEVMTRSARTEFIEGETRVLVLPLLDSCIDVQCEPGDTCDDGECVSIEVPPADLPPWTGEPPPLPSCRRERCDGEDNDCDSEIDEGFNLNTDRANCGECGRDCGLYLCKQGSCTGGAVRDVAAGGRHTCAALEAEVVACFGAADVGQLGELASGTSEVPVPVPGTEGATKVGAGLDHTCAIVNEEGLVACWGRNDRGQLGDGTTTMRTTPVMVMGVTGAFEVRGGEGHTCAALDSGRVKCWGAGTDGQLGDGMRADAPMPVEVSMLGVPNSVATGQRHTCAVNEAFRVFCWGDNASGQLGDGTTEDRSLPVEVPGLADVASVAAGRAHSCARTAQGAVYCWGANDKGQLGLGSTSARELEPMKVTVIGGTGLPVVDLTASSMGDHTCAATQDGDVYCWGANETAQLGAAPIAMGDLRAAPVKVGGVSEIAMVAAGGTSEAGLGHTCVLTNAETLSCFGASALGQLGQSGASSMMWIAEPAPVSFATQ